MGAPSQFNIGPDEELGRQGEAEWARLRLQLREGGSFELVFLFTASARSAEVVRQRLAALLREEGESLHRLQMNGRMPRPADELTRGSRNGTGGWGWVEAPGLDSWEEFLECLEESMAAVRRRHPGGLVVSALPLGQKALGKVAPQLSSSCSLLLNPLPIWVRPAQPTGEALDGQAAAFSPAGLAGQAPASLPAPQTEPAPEQAEADEPDRRNPVRRLVDGLLEKARQRLSQKDCDRARQAAQQALDLCKSSPDQILRARVFYCLACVERASAQHEKALERVEQALQSSDGCTEAERVKWFDLAAQLQLQAGESARALQHCRQGVALAQKAVQSQPRDLTTQRDLAVILSRQAEAHLKEGDAESAFPCLKESLDVRRQLVRRSRTAQTLRDLSYALYQMGIFQVRRGELEAAHKLTEESLYLDRKIIERIGATRSSVRDYAASLRLTASILDRLGRKEPAQLRRRQAERLEQRLKGK